MTITLSSCIMAKPFTSENVSKIRKHMSPQEVISIFGQPKGIGNFIAAENSNNPWKAMVYMYYYDCSHGSCKYNNNFVFNIQNPSNCYLEWWVIEYQY